jgi:hypothetical protein
MQRLRIVTLGISGGRGAHEAVTRRPPIPLYTMVPRTGGYAFGVGVWDLSIIQGPFSVAPCQILALRFAFFASCNPVVQGVTTSFGTFVFTRPQPLRRYCQTLLG